MGTTVGTVATAQLRRATKAKRWERTQTIISCSSHETLFKNSIPATFPLYLFSFTKLIWPFCPISMLAIFPIFFGSNAMSHYQLWTAESAALERDFMEKRQTAEDTLWHWSSLPPIRTGALWVVIWLIQLAREKKSRSGPLNQPYPVSFPEQSLKPAPKGVIITIDHNYTRPTYPLSAVPFQSSKQLNFIRVGIFYATQRKSSFHEILVTYGQTRKKHHPPSGHKYAHTQKKEIDMDWGMLFSA